MLNPFKDVPKEEVKEELGEVVVPLSVMAPILLKLQTPHGIIPLSYEGRPFLRQIVDGFPKMRKVYFLFGRQLEKSTSLAALPLLLSSIQRLTIQYTSGTLTQASEFSHWKLDGFIKNSEFLRSIYDTRGVQLMYNRREKESYTGSRILVGTAFGDAARIRGVPADWLEMDELELVSLDVVPVLQHSLAHSPYKYELHAATPMSTENTAWIYWDKYSVQHEWGVPCGCISHSSGVGRKNMNEFHWNILGPRNLTPTGPICSKCGKLVNTLEGKWLRTTPVETQRSWYAFRLPQLAAPYTDYNDIVVSMEQRPIETMQESFALSVTEAQQVFSDALIEKLAQPNIRNTEDEVYRKSAVYPVFVGIDWGVGGHAATVIVFGAYVQNRFEFIGGFRSYDLGLPDMEEYQAGAEVESYLPFLHLLRKTRFSKLAADAGMGYVRNLMLVSLFGGERFIQVQYVGKGQTIKFQPYDLAISVNRDEVLTNFVTAIKMTPSRFALPCMEDLKSSHWYQDLKAVKVEVSTSRKVGRSRVHYVHSESETDDFFHAMFNCTMASHMVYPRSDMYPPAAFQLT